MTDAKKKILFLCTGNAARSQMSEALARIDYPDLLDPVSAGSRPAGFVHPLAIAAIEELGFGLDDACSKSAEEFRDAVFDLVVTVCDSAAADCPTWPGARHLVNWSVEDPSFVAGSEEKRMAAFRVTRDDLRKRIDGLMEALRRSHPKRSDAVLLEAGAATPRQRPPTARLQVERRARSRSRAIGRSPSDSSRGGDACSSCRCAPASAWRSGSPATGGMLHPDYMECLGASPAMRYPGLSKDPLDAFRRLRADIARFAGPFLTGKGGKEFERFFDARKGKEKPAG